MRRIAAALLLVVSALVAAAPVSAQTSNPCSPRPPIRVEVKYPALGDPNIALVSLIPTRTEALQGNAVKSVSYTKFENVKYVATPNTPTHRSEPFTWTDEGWNNPVGATQFILFRDDPSERMQITFIARDLCGDWPSFVGIPPADASDDSDDKRREERKEPKRGRQDERGDNGNDNQDDGKRAERSRPVQNSEPPRRGHRP